MHIKRSTHSEASWLLRSHLSLADLAPALWSHVGSDGSIGGQLQRVHSVLVVVRVTSCAMEERTRRTTVTVSCVLGAGCSGGCGVSPCDRPSVSAQLSQPDYWRGEERRMNAEAQAARLTIASQGQRQHADWPNQVVAMRTR
jgi:hypothetical protein